MSGELLQNLRDFTIRICHATKNVIVGTGIVISTDGKILTCAHVVATAGVNPRVGKGIPSSWMMVVESIFGRREETLSNASCGEVGVYFPERPGRRGEARRARVLACFSEYEDDVVLLQLVGDPAPLGPEQIARLGTAEPSAGNKFSSYGYAPTGAQLGRRAGGEIRGTIERSDGSGLQADLVQLRSQEKIDPGMSGAAVLDVERNLVVGLIVEQYLPSKNLMEEFDYAVDNYVLTFDPFRQFDLPMQDTSLPLSAAPQPKTDIGAARAESVSNPGVSLNGAPPPLAEWVGREELLQGITADWTNPQCHVTGLIGFGGEGKSGLARRWLDQLQADPSMLQPGGVFWWNFYDKPNVDAFLETVLVYMSGGRIDPRRLPSTTVQVQVIGAMLGARRYLFILDGLEVMQHQEGDQYGLLVSADLREFVGYFAASGHDSFCLVTSRAPLLDLERYTTYTHRDVQRLNSADGHALLRRLGITGPDNEVDRVVEEWNGHALTLSLLGSYLMERHRGDVTHISDIPPPMASESRYERVQRMLRRYDAHLSEAEQTFLLLFSAFRLPVPESALASVFRAKTEDAAHILTTPLAVLDDQNFEALLKRLCSYHLLTYDAQTQHYTTHPLIRTHYATCLNEREPEQVQAVHVRIKDYYLSSARYIPHYPTLGELGPLIEAVHHACCAGAYDEACNLYREHEKKLRYELLAYETETALLLDFFPDGDTAQQPLMSDPEDKASILEDMGNSLMYLGRLAEAASFLDRSLSNTHLRSRAGRIFVALAELHFYRGTLLDGEAAALKAMSIVKYTQEVLILRDSIVIHAWIAHLYGELQEAGAAFKAATRLQWEIDPTVAGLYSTRGIWYAEYLRRIGQTEPAQRLTEMTLAICKQYRWPRAESQCHRMLGDLAADAHEYENARQQYKEALTLAQNHSNRVILIEGLLAWGRFAARQGDSETAHGYLNEALGYAVTGGYRLYEADIRIALAWAYRATGDATMARAQAERAQRMSDEMGYYWGQVDAKEVLAALDGGGP